MLRTLVLLLMVPACGAGSAAGPDAGGGDDDCADPAAVLPGEYLPIDSVSAGVVDTTSGAVTTTLVDARAGGFGNSDIEPFVYLAFSGTDASKVSITDVDSFESTAWHLALKRYVIRVNSGDSGPGAVEVASVAGTSLDAVTAVPEPTAFAEDDWATPDCTLVVDGLGAPLTAFGVWYEATDGVLTPLDLVFVLALPGGEHVKLRIASYYANPADATESAYFQLDWTTL